MCLPQASNSQQTFFLLIQMVIIVCLGDWLVHGWEIMVFLLRGQMRVSESDCWPYRYKFLSKLPLAHEPHFAWPQPVSFLRHWIIIWNFSSAQCKRNQDNYTKATISYCLLSGPVPTLPLFVCLFLLGLLFYLEVRDSRFLWNTGTYLPNYMVTAMRASNPTVTISFHPYFSITVGTLPMQIYVFRP